MLSARHPALHPYIWDTRPHRRQSASPAAPLPSPRSALPQYSPSCHPQLACMHASIPMLSRAQGFSVHFTRPAFPSHEGRALAMPVAAYTLAGHLEFVHDISRTLSYQKSSMCLWVFGKDAHKEGHLRGDSDMIWILGKGQASHQRGEPWGLVPRLRRLPPRLQMRPRSVRARGECTPAAAASAAPASTNNKFPLVESCSPHKTLRTGHLAELHGKWLTRKPQQETSKEAWSGDGWQLPTLSATKTNL